MANPSMCALNTRSIRCQWRLSIAFQGQSAVLCYVTQTFLICSVMFLIITRLLLLIPRLIVEEKILGIGVGYASLNFSPFKVNFPISTDLLNT